MPAAGDHHKDLYFPVSNISNPTSSEYRLDTEIIYEIGIACKLSTNQKRLIFEEKFAMIILNKFDFDTHYRKGKPIVRWGRNAKHLYLQIDWLPKGHLRLFLSGDVPAEGGDCRIFDRQDIPQCTVFSSSIFYVWLNQERKNEKDLGYVHPCYPARSGHGRRGERDHQRRGGWR
jgi:hypothetical protein